MKLFSFLKKKPRPIRIGDRVKFNEKALESMGADRRSTTATNVYGVVGTYQCPMSGETILRLHCSTTMELSDAVRVPDDTPLAAN